MSDAIDLAKSVAVLESRIEQLAQFQQSAQALPERVKNLETLEESNKTIRDKCEKLEERVRNNEKMHTYVMAIGTAVVLVGGFLGVGKWLAINSQIDTAVTKKVDEELDALGAIRTLQVLQAKEQEAERIVARMASLDEGNLSRHILTTYAAPFEIQGAGISELAERMHPLNLQLPKPGFCGILVVTATPEDPDVPPEVSVYRLRYREGQQINLLLAKYGEGYDSPKLLVNPTERLGSTDTANANMGVIVVGSQDEWFTVTAAAYGVPIIPYDSGGGGI